MKKTLLLILILFALLISGCSQATVTPITLTPTPTVVTSITPTPTTTVSVVATVTTVTTVTPSWTVTKVPTGTATQSSVSRTPTAPGTRTTATATLLGTRTPSPTITPLPVSSAPPFAGCVVFPPNNVWNHSIVSLPTHPNSATYIASLSTPGPSGLPNWLHPDFGAALWPPPGTPGTLPAPVGFEPVGELNQSPVTITFREFPGESDPGPYPIPTTAPIQGGGNDPLNTGDRHVFVVDQNSCMLYEMYHSHPQANGSWLAGSGAVWNLGSNENVNPSRALGWTSADASGLPMLPGFLRYEDIQSGTIRHALSFTAYRIRNTYIWPARHTDGKSTDAGSIPMGARLRYIGDRQAILSYCNSHFTADACNTIGIILTGLPDYGMILHDTGGGGDHSLGLAGVHDSRWDDDSLVNVLKRVHVSDFEVVDEHTLQANGPNSMQTP